MNLLRQTAARIPCSAAGSCTVDNKAFDWYLVRLEHRLLTILNPDEWHLLAVLRTQPDVPEWWNVRYSKVGATATLSSSLLVPFPIDLLANIWRLLTTLIVAHDTQFDCLVFTEETRFFFPPDRLREWDSNSNPLLTRQCQTFLPGVHLFVHIYCTTPQKSLYTEPLPKETTMLLHSQQGSYEALLYVASEKYRAGYEGPCRSHECCWATSERNERRFPSRSETTNLLTISAI